MQPERFSRGCRHRPRFLAVQRVYPRQHDLEPQGSHAGAAWRAYAVALVAALIGVGALLTTALIDWILS